MSHPVDVHVGKRLRQCREQRGLTQKQVADQIGLAFQQLQKYENASNRVSASVLWQLSRVLDVTPGHFFEGYEAKPVAAESDANPGSGGRTTIDLNRQFSSISDDQLRRRLVALIGSIADAGY